MKFIEITIRIIACCCIASYVSYAYAQTQEISSQSCESINGLYQFLGKNEDGDPREPSFVEVLFGSQIRNGKPTATELNYDAASNFMHVRIHRENQTPDPDFSLKVKCDAGIVVFEDSKSGHGDGSSYEMKSIFRISKDPSNALAVHKIYTIKSTNLLFFWSERSGEAHIRFLPKE
jgi:hypothetical protein